MTTTPTSRAPDHGFRDLPTPEQIRAHGDGGLWEEPHGALYRFWDRPRSEPWHDCSLGKGKGVEFCTDGKPWPRSAGRTPIASRFRPLNPDRTPRDWAEIDAATVAADATARAADTRAETDAGMHTHPGTSLSIVPPPGGQFQPGDVVKLYPFTSDEKFKNANPGWTDQMAACLDKPAIVVWAGNDRVFIEGIDCTWIWPIERVSFISRPGAGKPAEKPAEAPQPEVEFRQLTRELIEANPGQLWEGRCGMSGDTRIYEFRMHKGALQKRQPKTYMPDWFPWYGGFDSLAKVQWRPLHPETLQPMSRTELKQPTEPKAVLAMKYPDRLERAEDELQQAKLFTLKWLADSALDHQVEVLFNIKRKQGETDDQLRTRCAELPQTPSPLPKDGDPMTATLPNFVTTDLPLFNSFDSCNAAGEPVLGRFARCAELWTKGPQTMTTVLPNFATMSPEERARYRAALDAVDPPTTRDAVISGLQHAPVEMALDKLHLLVAKLPDLWTEGSEEERQTVSRFLRDLLRSDYGKAAIGLAAGAAIPHAAPLAAKLLPEDKDAAPLLRRIGFILVEYGTTTGAKKLGVDILSAAGPLLDELRSMLREALSGMRRADAVAGLLPEASKPVSFDVTTLDTATVKR